MPHSRSVFITGGSRGIGLALVHKFESEGWEVVAPHRSELELSDSASVQDYLKRSPIRADVLIANAGENQIAPLEELSFEIFDRILRVNLGSSFLLAQSASREMSVRGWGRMLFVSSVYSSLARPGRMAYSASKSGVNGLMRSLAVELGPKGILCNAICPGFVETDLTRKNNSPAQIEALASQTALKRLARPEEIAQAAYFLCSEANTYLTGQMVTVDGGFSVQ